MQSIYLPNNAETFKSISISIEACHLSVRKGTSGQFRLRSRYRSEYDDGTFQVILLNKQLVQLASSVEAAENQSHA